MVDQAAPGSDEPQEVLDAALERKVLALLTRRGEERTICPSDAARAVHADAHGGGEASDEGWRDLMEPARRAAARLVEAGGVVVTQRGQVVDIATATGPIRLRRAD